MKRASLPALFSLIKVQHTIFALPFALTGAALAAWTTGPDGLRQLLGWPLVLIVLCCVFARSAAMAFNRLVDHHIDAQNPRTANRELPAGVLKPRFVAMFTALNCAAFVLCAGLLNATALALSPVVLVVILGYSYTKRFTLLCHFVLGLALGMAPAGAWVAITAGLDWPPILLGLGVMFWTAGFDIIYACQDYDFDASQPGLHSLPKALGIAGALWVSRGLHVLAFGLFAAMLLVPPLGWAYTAGLIAAAALLIFQHSIISPTDLTRVNAAFFTANGVLSLVMCAMAMVDVARAAFAA